MMRIAHVIHGFPAESMGGTGLYVDALARALREKGHEVAVVSPDPSGATRRLAHDTPFEQWCVSTTPVRRWNDTWSGTTEPWKQWCADWKPDIVHFHHLSGWPLSLVEATPCRRIITLHDYAIPCARGQLLRSDLTPCAGPNPSECTRCLAPSLKSHPIINAVGRLVAAAPPIYAWARRAANRAPKQPHPNVIERLNAAKQTMSAADCLLSPSKDLALRMGRLGFGTPHHSELPLVRPTAPAAAESDGPTRFLFASSIIPSKGIDRLIRSFMQLDTPASLTIAGHAPPFDGRPGFADAIQRQAKQDPRITWLGAIPPDQVPALMQQHDVLVLPSIWPENSPLVVREATAHGLRIIGPKQGGCAELAPQAILIESDEELLSALKLECSQRRQKRPVQRWPSPMEHADHLLSTAYRHRHELSAQ